MASFSPHLNEDKKVIMLGDDINLTFRAAVVGLQDAEASLFKEFPSQLFSQSAGILALHFPRSNISLIGWNERR